MGNRHTKVKICIPSPLACHVLACVIHTHVMYIQLIWMTFYKEHLTVDLKRFVSTHFML